MKVVILPTNGTPYIADLAEPLHRSASALLGGLIEHVNPQGLKRPLCMLVNEEYMLLGLEFNPVASFLYGYQMHGHPVLGPAIILKETTESLIGLERKEALKVQVTMEALQNAIKTMRIFEDPSALDEGNEDA